MFGDGDRDLGQWEAVLPTNVLKPAASGPLICCLDLFQNFPRIGGWVEKVFQELWEEKVHQCGSETLVVHLLAPTCDVLSGLGFGVTQCTGSWTAIHFRSAAGVQLLPADNALNH